MTSLLVPVASAGVVEVRLGSRGALGPVFSGERLLLSDRGGEPVRELSRRSATVDLSCWRASVRGPIPDPAGAIRALDQCAASGGRALFWLLPLLGISLVLTGRHLRATVQLHALLREGRPVAPSRLDVPGRARVLVHDGVPGPFAAGFRTVVLPARSLRDLSPSQLRAVVAHEAVHLERKDPLWQWFARLVEGAFFFQPLNRVCRRSLEEVAELVSDDDARRRVGGGRALAESIALVSSWSLEGSVAPGLSRRRGLVGDRVSRLLDPDPGVQLPHFHLRMALVALVVVVAWSLPRIQGTRLGTAQVELLVGSVTEDVRGQDGPIR